MDWSVIQKDRIAVFRVNVTVSTLSTELLTFLLHSPDFIVHYYHLCVVQRLGLCSRSRPQLRTGWETENEDK